MSNPHKHATLIHAYADGAEIQLQNSIGEWVDEKYPTWNLSAVYRLKPKPDFNQTMDVYMNKMYKHYPNDFTKQRLMIEQFSLLGTMNLTFDGTTGQLKSAEVL